MSFIFIDQKIIFHIFVQKNSYFKYPKKKKIIIIDCALRIKRDTNTMLINLAKKEKKNLRVIGTLILDKLLFIKHT